MEPEEAVPEEGVMLLFRLDVTVQLDAFCTVKVMFAVVKNGTGFLSVLRLEITGGLQIELTVIFVVL